MTAPDQVADHSIFSLHRSGRPHMSTNAVMGTNKRRRHRAWPEAMKREIVAATLLPGTSVSRVARRYDVNANQVFAWRRRYRDVASEPAELCLLPVTVTPDHPRGMAPAGASEMIEIVLAGGYRVRVGDGVQASTLRLVLDVLERR
jgi:transposase